MTYQARVFNLCLAVDYVFAQVNKNNDLHNYYISCKQVFMVILLLPEAIITLLVMITNVYNN